MQPFIIARLVLFSLHMLAELGRLRRSGFFHNSLRENIGHCALLLQECFGANSFCPCAHGPGAKNAQEMQSHIDRIIARRRLHHTQLCASILCVPLSLLTFLGLVGGLPDNLDIFQEEYIITIGYFMLVLIKLQSSFINTYNLNFWYSFFMGCVAFWHTPMAAANRESFVGRTDDSVALLLGFLLSLMNLRAPWYIFWNVVVLSCHSYTTVFFELGHNRVAADLVCGFLVLTILRVLETALAQDVRRELECKAGRGHRAALASLLNQLCNAVVELDSQFKFVDDAAHLSLLLLQPGNRPLRGRMLHELFPDEQDRHKLDQQLENAKRQRTATLFQACLRDSSGEPVKVQVYIVGFQTLDDSVQFLIGLREYAEQSELLSNAGGLSVIRESNRANPEEHNTAPAPAPEMGRAEEMCRAEAMLENQSESNTSSLSAVPQSPIYVEFVAGGNFPICTVTSGFVSRYGKARPGTSLTEWLPFSPSFFGWVTDKKERIFRGELRTPRTEKFGNAFVTPILQRRSGAQLTRPGPQLLWVHFPNPSVASAYDGRGADNYTVRLTIPSTDHLVPTQIGRRMDLDSSSGLDLEMESSSCSELTSSRSSFAQQMPLRNLLSNVKMIEQRMHRPMQVDFFVEDDFPICAMSTTFASAFGGGAAGESLRSWVPFSATFFEWMLEQKRRILLNGSGGDQGSSILRFGYVCIVPLSYDRNVERQAGHRMVTVRFPDPSAETVNGNPMNETCFRASLCVDSLWLKDLEYRRQSL